MINTWIRIKGKVDIDVSFHPEKITNIIQCQTINKYSYLIPVEVPTNFAWVNSDKKGAFRFVENRNNLQIDTINEASNRFSKKEIFNRVDKFLSINYNSAKRIELPLYLSTNTLKNILKIIDKTLPGSFENTQIKDNYELSLDKFDIAKQTGITYPQFKILFHRYGTGIDEMIDKAYEMMETTRNPEIIWEGTENWFQKKYEWKT